MKWTKKSICILVCVSLLIATAFHAIVTVTANDDVSEIQLSDGSFWKIDTNLEKNTMGTDGYGRYTMTTTAPRTTDSAFEFVSRDVYPMNTQFQLSCFETNGYQTSFGLTTDYSLDKEYDGSIVFYRKNGDPSAFGARFTVEINGVRHRFADETPRKSYTAARATTISVIKQGGSWYLKWNDFVLDGAGCSDEIKEYCKLENHFPRSFLQSGNAMFHFVAGCENLKNANDFFFTPTTVIGNGITSVAADTYTDANTPTTVTKYNFPQVSTDSETGRYDITFVSHKTQVNIGAPVTYIDAETKKSAVFKLYPKIDHIDEGSRYWVYYKFSADPTFSDGTEIFVWAALLGDKNNVTHFGYDSVTAGDAGVNYYNDSQNRPVQMYFDKAGEKTYLFIKGDGLNSGLKFTGLDFSSLDGKPVYMRMEVAATNGRVISYGIVPSEGADGFNKIAELNAESMRTPTDYEDAESIIENYESSVYRYAVTNSAMGNILAVRKYIEENRDAYMQGKLQEIADEIDTLPEKAELADVYNSQLKEKIVDIYSRYVDMTDYHHYLAQEYHDKINGLVEELTVIDEEFKNEKEEVDEFNSLIQTLGDVKDLNVEIYPQKQETLTKLRLLYNDMSDIQLMLVDGNDVEKLEIFEEKIQPVKAAYDVICLIELLPDDMSEITYAHHTTIESARTQYTALTNPELVDQSFIDLLVQYEAALDEAKLRELDWYSPEPLVKFTGNKKDGYDFVSNHNVAKNFVSATTTDQYDMTKYMMYWNSMNCGSNQYNYFGLSNFVKGNKLSNTSADTVGFILRFTGSTLKVALYDKNGESDVAGHVPNFTMGALHTFQLEKGEDGHWYIRVDGTLLDGFHYDRLDTYMETYGTSTYVSIGGFNGFRADSIILMDRNESIDDENWKFSMPYGCSYTSDGENEFSVKLKKGAEAVYQKKIESIEGYSFTIDYQGATKGVIGGITEFALRTSNEPDQNKNTSRNDGILLRFMNRPAATDKRTHIQLWYDTRWSTIAAVGGPPILDCETFTISVVKDSDGHYYLKVIWDGGSVTIKYARGGSAYSRVQLDRLVKNGAYVKIGSMSADYTTHFKMSYTPPESDDNIVGDTTQAIGFILDFEKNLDKVISKDRAVCEAVYKKWKKIDFFSQNSVYADLMDDTVAYDALTGLIKYAENGYTEEVITIEQIEVMKSELQQVIDSYLEDTDAEYTFTHTDGTVIFSNDTAENADS